MDLLEFDKKYLTYVQGKARASETGSAITTEELYQYVQQDHALLFGHLFICRAFTTAKDFTSGFGIQYTPSTIVSTTHQAIAPPLIIGKRLPPQMAIYAASAESVEIQDLCVADTRFKIFVFTGPAAGAHVDAVATELERTDGWWHRFGGYTTFDIITVCQGNKETIQWLSVPKVLRPHWRKYVYSLVNVAGGLSFARSVLTADRAQAAPRRHGHHGHDGRQGV